MGYGLTFDTNWLYSFIAQFFGIGVVATIIAVTFGVTFGARIFRTIRHMF